MWSIARYTYYRWMRKWTHHQSLDEVWGISCEREIDAALLEAEELQLLRRELSFLSESHRKTIVYYYFHGKSCGDIAELLGVSPGTVKWRLFEARKQLKRGMGEMRNFGEKSYNPSRLVIGINGKQGNDDSPFSLTDRIIPQNLLLAAYERPKTIEELSEELGIARPYLEEEVQLLLDGELLRRTADAVQTDFIIIDRAQILAVLKEIRECTDQFIERVITHLEINKDRIMNILKNVDLSWERLLWLLIPDSIGTLSGKFMNENCSWHSWNELPIRPHGGRWICTGGEIFDRSQHTKEEIDLVDNWFLIGPYSSTIDGIKMWCISTVLLGMDYSSAKQLNKTDYQICRKIAFKTLSSDALTDIEKEALVKGVEQGYIRKINGEFQLTFPLLTNQQVEELQQTALELYDQVLDNNWETYRKVKQLMQPRIPVHLHSSFDTSVTSLFLFGRVSAALVKAYDAGMLSRIDEKNKTYLGVYMSAAAENA
ncbi:MAG TPA: hypothetical protein GX019_04025 [Firmicutes bacterium]|nr:hypothetical protein [Bacillota bacterium]